MTTLSFGNFLAGRSLFAAGCQGNAVLTLRRGQPGRAAWAFQGVLMKPTATPVSGTVTPVTTVAPRVGAVHVHHRQHDLPRHPPKSSSTSATPSSSAKTSPLSTTPAPPEPTGYRSAYITDRSPRIKISPESLGLSVKDWYDFHRTSATAALVLTVGSTGNGYTITAPKLQLANPPSLGERDGMLVDDLEFVCVGSAGDDELSFQFLLT